MKETYAVKLPKKIIFGDPLYFEEFKGKKLDRLVVNFHPLRPERIQRWFLRQHPRQ